MSGMKRGNRTIDMKEQERLRSSLILRGRLAKEMAQEEDAVSLFAEAARLEESLSDAYAAQGIQAQAWRHRFSAVGCWSQAGNFLRALELSDALIDETDIPQSLREHVMSYAKTLRKRRNRLWEEIRQAEPHLIAV